MKNRSKGQALVSLVITGASAIGIVYAFVYSSLFQPLQAQQYSDHAAISSLAASVADIKENTTDIPALKAEVDFLARQRGYYIAESTTTNQ